MINPSKIDTLGVTGTPGSGSALRPEPPAGDVEKFNKLMADAPETRQVSEGGATKEPEKDINTIINEYMEKLKQQWGAAEFQRRKDEAFPGGNAKDIDFAKYLYLFEQYILDTGKQNLIDFQDRIKENQL